MQRSEAGTNVADLNFLNFRCPTRSLHLLQHDLLMKSRCILPSLVLIKKALIAFLHLCCTSLERDKGVGCIYLPLSGCSAFPTSANPPDYQVVVIAVAPVQV
jgi:hypothetical protein